jgi:flagellar biosynthetic protein FliR
VEENLVSPWIASILLLGLRVAPSFAFAPPFTSVPLPRLCRLLFGFGLTMGILGTRPSALVSHSDLAWLVPAAARELGLGILFVLLFHLLYGALHVAGRTIDIQAGFGLALLIDPATRAQTPLVGTLFALATTALFFAIDGHLALLRLMATSLDAVPIGLWSISPHPDHLLSFIAIEASLALGFAGAVILLLFLIDLAIALLSRTVPQMNVLVFGFQAKTLALLAGLPLLFASGATLLLRMMAILFESIPSLL